MFLAPTNCPSCDTLLILSKTKTDLICPNFDKCPDQILKRLSYFCGRNIANITGLSDEKLRILMNEFAIKNVSDLYDLDYDMICNLDNFGKLSTQNLASSIEISRQLLVEKFLAGLGIDGIGVENAKLICRQILENIKEKGETEKIEMKTLEIEF